MLQDEQEEVSDYKVEVVVAGGQTWDEGKGHMYSDHVSRLKYQKCFISRY